MWTQGGNICISRVGHFWTEISEIKAKESMPSLALETNDLNVELVWFACRVAELLLKMSWNIFCFIFMCKYVFLLYLFEIFGLAVQMTIAGFSKKNKNPKQFSSPSLHVLPLKKLKCEEAVCIALEAATYYVTVYTYSMYYNWTVLW